MAVPYVRLSIQGTLPGGEVWSVNPSFIGNFEVTPPSHVQLQTWATDSADFLMNLDVGNALLALLSTAATIDTVRASAYGANGRLVDYAEAALEDSQTGTTPLTQTPTAACCISLYTEIPGRQYRGRLFWPALGVQLDGDTGRIPNTVVTAVATGAEAMLAGIEAASPGPWDAVLAVYSSTRGAGTAITQIRVGNVLDSQRGRKDALVEAYATVPYTP